jgi:hypothetical protein
MLHFLLNLQELHPTVPYPTPASPHTRPSPPTSRLITSQKQKLNGWVDAALDMAGGMEPGSGSLPVSVQTVLLYIDNASKDVRVRKNSHTPSHTLLCSTLPLPLLSSQYPMCPQSLHSLSLHSLPLCTCFQLLTPLLPFLHFPSLLSLRHY